MSISFQNALGIHEQALEFRSRRAEVLGNNIANASTPHYKARDLDFSAVLAEQAQKASNGKEYFDLATTDNRHIVAESVVSGVEDAALRYRIPTQPSLDQNTVDEQVEQASYAENAMQFQASFTLLNSKFKGLVAAIRGE
ncbi:flagellar basal body rod protein FlgB [Azomonas macrocytogenes]|uniref:Flagellar basal body rod protein FlgB n=1 Tax=Azomonas macrocytogenes TaxID=69962 RepID=A0A839T964_AZOMA|nr:flagellar basal body rod protein FlgB [Azomonas macrocytogenes]MBB3104996.1 flagellar basal-body rod protein FlgB [Azomonas macrocytogenes]